MRLASEGYGSLKEIKELPVDEYFQLIHYENFKAEYKEIFRLLNTKK